MELFLRRFVVFFVLLVPIRLLADPLVPKTKPALWQKVFLFGVAYPMTAHQLPLLAIHEASHVLAFKAVGGDKAYIAKMNLWPSYELNDKGKWSFYGTETYYWPKRVDGEPKPTFGAKALVLTAPYIVQIFVVDRSVETLYRRRKIRIDSFGDKYTQATLQLNMNFPLENALRKSGDLNKLARLIPAPKIVRKLWIREIVVGAAVQLAYLKSYERIQRARGHEDSPWTLYFHRTF